MSEQLYSVKLTTDEIILLDGKVGPEVQKSVDLAKEAKALEGFAGNAAEARFIADVVREAETNGRLILRWTSLHYCQYSGKAAGYAKRSRHGKYHRKGDTNFSKPLSMAGVELADRFVRLSGYASVGCCREFWDAVRPKLAIRLQDVRAEIPEEITGHKPRWKRFDKKRCTKCGWVGHDGQMGKLPCLMSGEYPGECPKCRARNLPFGPHPIESIVGEFELVPVETKE